MAKNPALSPTERRMCTPRVLLVPVCLGLVLCSGCLVKKRPAAHFENLVLAHPAIPAATAEAALSEAPDLGIEPVAMPVRVGAPRNPPARPKVAASPAT